MTSPSDRVEIITSVQRRRRWSPSEKVRMVEETFEPGSTVSLVARRHGVAPNQLFTWRRLAAQGALTAAGAEEEVVPASDYRALQNQIRELHRLLGKKTLEAEILKEALEVAAGPKRGDVALALVDGGRSSLRLQACAACLDKLRRVPMKNVADVIGVARSNLAERAKHRQPRPIGRPPQPDVDLVAEIVAVIADLPTYGYRRVHAILRRRAMAEGRQPPNHKRVYGAMKRHGLLLQRHAGGAERRHDGRISVAEPNLRWCSDGFEVACDNGERVRIAFALDCCDREAMSYVATTGGIGGDEVRHLMLAAIEHRFGPTDRLPDTIEWLSDNGSGYIAHETRRFARSLGLEPRTTPVESPQSNGMAEAFVRTIKREINGLSPAERQTARDTRSRPLVEALQVWLRQNRQKLSAKAPMAKAIDYMLKRWPAFTRFLDDGRICLSNNAAERAIRPIAVGRRNWTFAGSDAGGRRAAAMYTLIETAKLNGIDPRAWLADVLARLPDHPAHRVSELLPWNSSLQEPQRIAA